MSWICPCGASVPDGHHFCRACGYTFPPDQSPPAIACKVCDRGSLVPKKIFRLSGPAVVIGFVLLIPSVLGIIASALLFFGVIYSDAEANRARSEAIQQMHTNRVPGPIIAAVLAGQDQEVDRLMNEWPEPFEFDGRKIVTRGLDQSRRSWVRDAQEKLRGSGAGFAVLGAWFSVALGIACFVGGLLGWLLVMRKRVLQCSTCGATTNAASVPGAATGWTWGGALVSVAGCVAILAAIIVLNKTATPEQSSTTARPAMNDAGGVSQPPPAQATSEPVPAAPPTPDPSTERIEALRQRKAELAAQIRHDSALVDDVYRDQFRCPPSGTVGSPATCAGLEPMKYNLGGATQRVIFDLMGKVIGLRKEAKYIDSAIANLKAGRPEDWAPPAAPAQATSEAAGGGEAAPPTAP